MADGRARDPAAVEWDWAAHEQAQRRRYAELPLVDKIAWLEEAQRLVLSLQQQRRKVENQPAVDQTDG